MAPSTAGLLLIVSVAAAFGQAAQPRQCESWEHLDERDAKEAISLMQVSVDMTRHTELADEVEDRDEGQHVASSSAGAIASEDYDYKDKDQSGANSSSMAVASRPHPRLPPSEGSRHFMILCTTLAIILLSIGCFFALQRERKAHKRMLTHEDPSDDKHVVVEIPMGESAYTGIVISLEGGGATRQFLPMTILILVLSLGVQKTFTTDMLPVVTARSMNDLYGMLPPAMSHNLFEDWRIYADSVVVEGRSLTDWSCSGEHWSSHAVDITDMQEFASDSILFVPQGVLFGVLATFLWCCFCLNQMRDISCYGMLVLLNDPSEGATDPGYQYDRDSDEAHLTHLSRRTKLVVLVILAVRQSILCTLCLYGIIWLSHSKNLTDLVLNAVALGFILDIDGLFFATFIHPKEKKAVESLKAPVVRISPKDGVASRVTFALYEYSDVCAILVVLALVSWGYYFFLGPFTANYMHEALAKVCK